MTNAAKKTRPTTDWMVGSRFTKEELLILVKDHALKMYGFDGWDFMVECHDDSEVLAAIGGARTFAGACENVARNLGLKLHDERRSEVMAEIF